MSRLTQGTVIGSFEQLEDGLREWMSFGDPQAYDAGGMMVLLCACVDNLRQYALPAELEAFGAGLREEQRAILKTLAESR
jgi:hypothetical protein